MLSDVVRMVPGGRTDSRRPRRCWLRRSRAGRGAWPGGAAAVCSWTSAVSAGQMSPFRMSGRCPPIPRCWQPPLPRVSAKDRNVRVGLQSLARRHTPSYLPPETGQRGQRYEPDKSRPCRDPEGSSSRAGQGLVRALAFFSFLGFSRMDAPLSHDHQWHQANVGGGRPDGGRRDESG
jgi:hypothetical protein